MGEITWYLSFFEWLISLSIIPSRSIYAVMWGKSSFFLWVSNIPLYIYLYYYFFIHSSIDGYFGCFHILAIINNTTMNIEVHIFFWISVWIVDIYNLHPSTSELLGHKALPFLIFWGLSILFSMVVVLICIPSKSTRGFPFLHNLRSGLD